MKKAILEVDKILDDKSKKNQKELSSALVLPLSNDYPFASNGIYFYVGKVGSGKTYGVIRHILITENITSEPYYDQIIISATSGSMDKTSKTFMNECRAPVTKVSDTELMDFLNKHVRQKAKYYAISKFLESKMTVITDDMRAMINKHRLIKDKGTMPHRSQSDLGEFDMRRLTNYILSKLSKYPFSKSPSNTVLILDDFGGHKLLNKSDSPLANFITKVRHYNYTVIIMCQTWRHISLNIRRLCTNFVIFQGYSYEDIEAIVKQSGCSTPFQDIWERYKKLISPRSYMEIHVVANSVKFNDVFWNKRTIF